MNIEIFDSHTIYFNNNYYNNYYWLCFKIYWFPTPYKAFYSGDCPELSVKWDRQLKGES